MTPTKALQTIVEHQHLKSLNYCVNYAKAALQMNQDSHEFNIQVLYVLSNMTHWRGPLAKQVRQALKQARS